MTKIVVTYSGATPSADLIKYLHKALGRGVSDVQRALQARTPLYVSPLFGNDHDENAATLRGLLASEEFAACLRFFELDDEDEFASVADASTHELDASTVANILDAFDVEVKRQHRLSSEE